MKFNNFIHYFSSPRIERYLTACTNDRRRCIKFYKSNHKVAQAFHPLLSMLEVILRNGINDQLTNLFADPDWIINQKTGFMVDSSLVYIKKRTGHIEKNRFLLNSINSTESKLKERGIAITSGRVISEQTFGFWTDLFENHHYRVLRGRPIQMFRNLPSGFGRSEVLKELTKIRQFRNRINHNEPICFIGPAINFTNTINIHHSIQNIFTWISPELLSFTKDMDKVSQMILEAQKV